MKQHIRRSLATFSLLSISIALAHAAPDVNQLQQQVSQLEKSLNLLKSELNQLKSQQENRQASDTQVRNSTVKEAGVSENVDGVLAQDVDAEDGEEVKVLRLKLMFKVCKAILKTLNIRFNVNGILRQHCLHANCK